LRAAKSRKKRKKPGQKRAGLTKDVTKKIQKGQSMWLSGLKCRKGEKAKNKNTEKRTRDGPRKGRHVRKLIQNKRGKSQRRRKEGPS